MERNYLLMIMGMTAVTYLPRYIPLAVLSRLEIPPLIVNWLKYIPPAILAALLAPGILLVEGRPVLTVDNIFLLASLPAFAVAIYRKNIFLTVLTGMGAVLILDYFI